MSEGKNWCVYKHTNLVNGKIYIGKTCKKPEYRWNNGKGYKFQRHFWYAIQKYGWENFSHEVLQTNLTSEEATNLERALIAELNTMDPNAGYNQTAGGEGMTGWHHTEESLEKIRKSNSARQISEETRKKMSATMKEKFAENGNPFKGKKHKESTKTLLSTLSSKRWEDPEYREKMLKALNNEKRTRKISAAQKKKWQDSEYRDKRLMMMASEEYRISISIRNKGRKHTPEELQKMSLANTGNRNGMSGKHGSANPNSKPVCQYSVNGDYIARYDNATEASKKTGVSNATIGMCCNRKLATSGNYIWRYEGDLDLSLPATVRDFNIRINQFDKEGTFLRSFENVEEAARYCNGSKYAILKACREIAKSSYGFVWSFEGNEPKPYVINYAKRIVLQFTMDGEFISEYESLKEACDLTGLPEANMSACCLGKTKTAGGYLFFYDDEFSESVLTERINSLHKGRPPRRVLMFSLEGEYEDSFESARKASEVLGVTQSAINMNCHGKVGSTGYHIFMYEEEYSNEELEKRVHISANEHETRLCLQQELSSGEKELLAYYSKHPEVSQNKAATDMGVSPKTIWRWTKTLVKKGAMVRIGSDKKGIWKVMVL